MSGNEHTLGEILGQFLQGKQIRDKYQQVQLKHLWRETLGATIDQHTTDLRLHKGILTIVVNSSPLRQELLFGIDTIKERLNQALGKPEIKEIKVF